MRRFFSLIPVMFFLLAAIGIMNVTKAQDEMAAVEIYNAKGQTVALKDVIEALDNYDVVFVGELHNDRAAHAVELEVLQGAFARYGVEGVVKSQSRPMALSLEMFERDVQHLLDEYLAGMILERQFLAGSRPWNNYQTDYRPLVEFARGQKLPVLAANAPDRYVNRVSRLGREALKELPTPAKTWIAPLPYGEASAAYSEKFRAVMGGMPAAAPGGAAGGHSSPHGALHLLDAQALRDATMAYSIAEHLKRQPRALVIHVNGNFHSEGRLGTPEQLLALRPGTRLLVVSVVGGEAPTKIDAETLRQLGDFVVYKKRNVNRSF